MATDTITSPQSSVSLDEWGSEAWMEGDSDSAKNMPRGRESAPPSVKEALTAEGEDMGSGPPKPETAVVETPGNLSGVDEGFPLPPPCTDLPSPAEGVTEAESKPTPEDEVGVTDSQGSSGSAADSTSDSLSNQDSASVDSQEWPPTPLLDAGAKVEEDGDMAVEMKDEVIKNPVLQAERSEQASVLIACSSTEPGVLSSEQAPEKGEDNIARCADDWTEPQEESDSPVFLSEDGEDRSVDRKLLNFTSAWEQWVRMDSSSGKPPAPACSRTASSGRVAGASPTQSSQQQTGGDLLQPCAVTQDAQQEEQLTHSPALMEKNQEARQVCEGTPPIATVASEPANHEAGRPGSGSIVAKGPLTVAGGRREGEREERESGQTGAAGHHTGEAERERERQREAEDSDGGEEEGEQEKAEGNQAAQVPLSDRNASRMDVDHFDDNTSDSGVSADFSPNCTAELQTGAFAPEPQDVSQPPPNETPIEREIRLAAQRERSLRRSRGLGNAPEVVFVDIPVRRSILSQELPSKSGRSQGKDRQFAGKKMQREISLEAQREQVLVQLGRLSGSYDKGTVRQLRERKLLFEAFQEPKESLATTPSHTTRSSSACDFATLGARGNETSASSVNGSFTELRHSLEPLTGGQSLTPLAARGGGFAYALPPAPRGPGLSAGARVIILENDLVLPAPSPSPDGPRHTLRSTGQLAEPQAVTVVDSGTALFPSSEPGGLARRPVEGHKEEEEEESAVPKENPFFKLRSSMSLRPEVEQDIREAREREQELRRQRTSLYGGAGATGVAGGGGGGGGRPLSREIRSPIPLQNGLPAANQHSKSFSTKTSARQSLGRLDRTWPPQADVAQGGQSEALRSPKSQRQKTPLLERWESGMVNGHGEDQD